MPPQPHPPVAEGAWLRPRPARQSPDCRRGRVHRHASRRPARVRLKAAAFPAQHIRSALSQVWPAVRRTAGSGGFLRGAASGCGAVCRRPARSEYLPSPDRRHLACLRPRLPPSPPPPRAAAPPARSAHHWHGERVKGELSAQLRTNALTLLTVRGAERAPQKRTSADSAQGARRACHGARANPAPRGARRRRDGCDWRREASRPSQARRSGGWIAPRG